MKDIKITVENYDGRTLTYTAPQSAEVDVWTVSDYDGEVERLIEVHINLEYKDIKEEESNG